MPGTSGTIGRLTFKGDVGLDGGAAVLIDVGTGDSDRLVVKATPTSAGYLQLGGNGGVSLNLAAVGTGPRFGKVYTIATADGGVSSTFSSVQGSFGVLTPALTYNPKDITLTFVAGSLAAQLPATATTTELAFAKALDQLRTGSYSNLSNLYGAVDLMDSRSLGLTLRGLAPVGLGETMALGREQNALITNLVTDRFSVLGSKAARGGTLTMLGSADGRPHTERFNGSLSGAIQSSFAPHLAPSRVIDARLPESVSGFVSMGFASGRSSLTDAAPGQASGRRNWHYAMGLETRLGDSTTIGSAVGYVEGESQVLGNRTDVRTSQAVVYGNRLVGARGYVAGLASLSYNRFGLLRSVSDSASLQRLHGFTTAISTELRAEAGLNFAVAGGLTLTPRAGLRVADIRVGALRENGGELALRINGLHDQRLEASAGVKLTGTLPLGGGWRFSPSLQADLVQRAAGSGGTVSVRFDAADALAFALPLGVQPARWIAAKGGVQLTNRGLTIAAGFETDAPRDGVRNDSAFAAVSLAF